MAKRLKPTRRHEIEDEVEREIADAITFAEDSPYPAEEELYKNVFR